MEGRFLIKVQSLLMHYCEACQTMHPLPATGWTYNYDCEKPTFHPSFKHYLHDHYDGRTESYVKATGICHYVITAGQIYYHSDSTHAYANQTVPMVEVPVYFQEHVM